VKKLNWILISGILCPVFYFLNQFIQHLVDKHHQEGNLPYDPAIPLLGIYPKECNTGFSRGTCTPMFIHNSQVMETTKMPHY
jgi:hypothetical protein